MKKWKHAILGEWTFDEYLGWSRVVTIEHAKLFQHEAEDSDEPSNQVAFYFSSEDNPETPPTDGMIELAKGIFDQPHEFFNHAVGGLLDDFHGRGKASGMWWHNNIDEILEVDELSKDDFSSVESLNRVLGSPSIKIYNAVYRYDSPCALVSFLSDIDMEHGVGVLCNLSEILGVSYGYEPYVFESG